MTRNRKIILIVVAAVLVICVGVCGIGFFVLPKFAQRAFSQDPAQAKQIGAQIAQYDVPPDYQEKMGMDIFTTKMVALGPKSGNGIIFVLMGINGPGMSRQEMEQQMQQAFQQQFQRNTGTMNYVGQEDFVIRGESVPFTITESSSSSKLRQAVGGFTGDHGFVMVMATGSKAEWDEDLLKNFVTSIH